MDSELESARNHQAPVVTPATLTSLRNERHRLGLTQALCAIGLATRQRNKKPDPSQCDHATAKGGRVSFDGLDSEQLRCFCAEVVGFRAGVKAD